MLRQDAPQLREDPLVLIHTLVWRHDNGGLRLREFDFSYKRILQRDGRRALVAGVFRAEGGGSCWGRWMDGYDVLVWRWRCGIRW